MTCLLDANVLIALVDPDHVHHRSAGDWFSGSDEMFATCPITQGALVRHLLRVDHSISDIGAAIARIQALPRHEFWPDDVPFTSKVIAGIVGHRQVTDSYLCHLASGRRARLVTFDRALAAIHPDVAMLVPVG